MQKLNAANVPNDLIEKGQNRVIDASLTLIRERAKLKVVHLSILGFLILSLVLITVPFHLLDSIDQISHF